MNDGNEFATDLELVKERYSRAAKAQKKVNFKMEHSRLFYRGDQWLRVDSQRWVTAPKKPWKVRLTINMFPPAVEGNVSVFMRSKPIIIVSPATNDDDDIRTARVTEQLLRSRWQTIGLEEEEIEMLTWMFTAGNGFLRVRWDKDKGRLLPKYKTVQYVDEEGEYSEEEEIDGYIREGATVVESLDPFSIAIEPGARKFEDAAWVIVTEFMRKDVVMRRFGLNDLKPDVNEDSSDKAMTEMYAPAFLDHTGRKKPSKDRIPIYTMYERPTRAHEKGQVIYTTNDKFLKKGDLPDGEIRIVHFKNIRIPGELWANSIVGEGAPLQYEYNRSRSQIVENRNLTSRPKLIAPAGALEIDEVTSEPGEIIEYDQVGVNEPHWLATPSLPNYVQQELQWIRQDIDDITSRHEASQGKFSSAITSGKQAELHQQADTSRYFPQILLFEQGLSLVGKYIVSTEKENLTGDQIVQIVGKNLEQEVYSFDMNDVTDTSNIKFEIASQWPWAREAMRQTLYHLHSIGAITTEQLLDRLEIPTSSSTYESDQENKRNAEAENKLLLEGMEFDPLPTDDARAHMRWHLKAANLPENRLDYLENREQLNALYDHMSKHHKEIPKPEPPPIAPKLNISARDIVGTPEGMELITQIVREAMGVEAASQENPPEPPTEGGRAPGMGGQGSQGMPTPMGGMDGQLQGDMGPVGEPSLG